MKHRERLKAKLRAAPRGELAAKGTPSRSAPPAFPVVGIGASAGGLGAFEAFFSGIPEDVEPAMAFVLVQHLAPDHESLLADLVRRFTRMKVVQAEDGMALEPSCVYVIPPNRDMAILNGTLQLMEPSAPRGQRLPIDVFFRSLAQDQRDKAIAVVLSGTGSDGAAGVRAIKGEGGMVMAQTPSSTEYDGMPRSAIATGLVDYELGPAEMAAEILAYVDRTLHRPGRVVIPTPKAESILQKVFLLLRTRTGHDFSQYKPSTVHRRIERRMAVHQHEGIDAYLELLRESPGELDALFRDLLIGVTSFFRDPEGYRVLEEQVIPKLFLDRPAGAAIRVWSAGCSTGEEVYSLAILLAECQERTNQSFKIQVFGTDIDARAIATARAGIYPASIVTDVSPKRLARFFIPEPDGAAYRVHKSLRDLVVFSEQDVGKDPPFSRLDLVSCRNLLIYMNGELQKRLIPLFHYALSPGGFLFLGSSESVSDFNDLFTTVDRKWKLYQRREDPHAARHRASTRFLPPMSTRDLAPPRAAALPSPPKRPPLRELAEQALLQHLELVAALVNAQGDILYLHGRTGRYLEPTPGESGVNNMLKMAREGLRRDLAAALQEAETSREIVQRAGLRVRTNGDFTVVDLTVRPVVPAPTAHVTGPLFLVVLRDVPIVEPAVEPTHPSTSAVAGTGGGEGVSERRIVALKQELRAKEEHLQTSNEELETSNEELRSSNEELQSTNEELQSANEELETSKEELQSVNEELATVNTELQTKVADLSRANNDMNNLLAGTGIGTLFVDHNLRIVRFTPATTRIINLIPSDVGRPVSHLVSNLTGYDQLAEDTQSVLDTLTPKEVEVQTKRGAWFVMHILPYRTLENVIEGAVITFVDITERRKAEADLQESQRKVARLLELLPVGVSVHNAMNQIVYVNPAFARIFGMSREALLRGGDQARSYLGPAGQSVSIAELASGRAIREQQTILNVETGFVKEDGQTVWVSASAIPIEIADWRAVVLTTALPGPPAGAESRPK